jgi:hypothetical protein
MDRAITAALGGVSPPSTPFGSGSNRVVRQSQAGRPAHPPPPHPVRPSSFSAMMGEWGWPPEWFHVKRGSWPRVSVHYGTTVMTAAVFSLGRGALRALRDHRGGPFAVPRPATGPEAGGGPISSPDQGGRPDAPHPPAPREGSTSGPEQGPFGRDSGSAGVPFRARVRLEEDLKPGISGLFQLERFESEGGQTLHRPPASVLGGAGWGLGHQQATAHPEEAGGAFGGHGRRSEAPGYDGIERPAVRPSGGFLGSAGDHLHAGGEAEPLHGTGQEPATFNRSVE